MVRKEFGKFFLIFSWNLVTKKLKFRQFEKKSFDKISQKRKCSILWEPKTTEIINIFANSWILQSISTFKICYYWFWVMQFEAFSLYPFYFLLFCFKFTKTSFQRPFWDGSQIVSQMINPHIRHLTGFQLKQITSGNFKSK